jgi:hypothetical protein
MIHHWSGVKFGLISNFANSKNFDLFIHPHSSLSYRWYQFYSNCGSCVDGFPSGALMKLLCISGVHALAVNLTMHDYCSSFSPSSNKWYSLSKMWLYKDIIVNRVIDYLFTIDHYGSIQSCCFDYRGCKCNPKREPNDAFGESSNQRKHSEHPPCICLNVALSHQDHPTSLLQLLSGTIWPCKGLGFSFLFPEGFLYIPWSCINLTTKR